jgi:hypothetical protein
MEFLKLPVDIQNRIIAITGFCQSVYSIFPDHFKSIFKEGIYVEIIIKKILLEADSASLSLLIKEGFLSELLLLQTLHSINWNVDMMGGLCMLVALSAILQWNTVGKLVVIEIDKLGLLNVRKLLGNKFPADI